MPSSSSSSSSSPSAEQQRRSRSATRSKSPARKAAASAAGGATTTTRSPSRSRSSTNNEQSSPVRRRTVPAASSAAATGTPTQNADTLAAPGAGSGAGSASGSESRGGRTPLVASKRTPASHSSAATSRGLKTTATTATTTTISAALRAVEHTAYEFGGPVGCLSIMVVSHVILYYVYYALHFNGGNMYAPTSLADVGHAASQLVQATTPTAATLAFYVAFVVVEGVFACVLPGLDLLGRPDDKGDRLVYRCNGLLSWYLTLVGIAIAFYKPAYEYLFQLEHSPLVWYYDNMGRMMSTAVLAGNGVALACYVYGRAANMTHRMTGSVIYDFFMGAILHPRIGLLDFKFFAEIRISWYLLFINTVSCVAKLASEDKPVPPSLYLLVLAHGLYANATAKGEHYVPPTWDMFYEKFGWMLSFWNFAGVPFLYCLQSVYLVTHDPEYSVATVVALAVILLAAYYIWDTAQSQKNHFRLEREGTVVKRWTFPNLPWRTLTNPKVIETASGSPLLVDGWWQFARKIHYSCDICFALIWGLSCGFGHFLPYFYVIFFTSMILHRYDRDMTRCALKYGKDWDRYLEAVPYAFIPGIF
ncbi:hypothetical protein CAOG_01185 [Capsaspora owczarzaki ATCC 30864]|uniref:Delta(24(24(1)))-sterol reductase n=1 Tax=Capsaspora owczarzaki (strain ATCC 30864) TaxID=595528 RepID=A0A0D2U3H0_CAPO3|nr:hypothetical protein CAOG_01185 [Capsaspora owczarzaki ATCC 30864]KJE89756.1 hypothetical protein CAOG_001185 [Capsaspora owczarzaki ATCC 30864]|eukprot:XP_004366056.1 hypothetical protein CAOG_01185 [Capsaspora owczarzaki ATCC 30864]